MKKRVIVSGVATDPDWPDDYREPALKSGIRAAWSEPILTKDKTLKIERRAAVRPASISSREIKREVAGDMANAQLPINYGDEFGKCFALKEAPSVLLKPKSRSQIAITRLMVKKGLVELPKVIPEKAFTISVHLYKPVCHGWGAWVDGKFLPVESWMEGGVGIYDLESDPRVYRNSAFDSVHYNLPRTTLDAFTEETGQPRVGALLAAEGARDDTLFHLTKLILPALSQPNLFCQLFLDHFVLMLCSHVVHTYRASRTAPKVYHGGLAPWQARRVTEMLHQHLDGELRLSKFATECGLSVSHFARSFKISFGAPVHQYLISQRLESAKDLLLHSNKSLSEIAIQVGFSDQAAFSRTFSAVARTTPGRWRRENAHIRSSHNFASSFKDRIVEKAMQALKGGAEY